MEHGKTSTPKTWREGAVANPFKKGDKADQGNYGGITLLSTFGKTLKHRVVAIIEKK